MNLDLVVRCNAKSGPRICIQFWCYPLCCIEQLLSFCARDKSGTFCVLIHDVDSGLFLTRTTSYEVESSGVWFVLCTYAYLY